MNAFSAGLISSSCMKQTYPEGIVLTKERYHELKCKMKLRICILRKHMIAWMLSPSTLGKVWWCASFSVRCDSLRHVLKQTIIINKVGLNWVFWGGVFLINYPFIFSDSGKAINMKVQLYWKLFFFPKMVVWFVRMDCRQWSIEQKKAYLSDSNWVGLVRKNKH